MINESDGQPAESLLLSRLAATRVRVRPHPVRDGGNGTLSLSGDQLPCPPLCPSHKTPKAPQSGPDHRLPPIDRLIVLQAHSPRHTASEEETGLVFPAALGAVI